MDEPVSVHIHCRARLDHVRAVQSVGDPHVYPDPLPYPLWADTPYQ